MPGSTRLVGITQRVVDMPNGIERRDTLDQAWTGFLGACGFGLIPIPNHLEDPVSYLVRVGVNAIVLSGGGNVSSQWRTRGGLTPRISPDLSELAPERDELESKLLRANLEQNWPVIGVCRGMQFINLFHGGRLEPVSGHAGTHHNLSVAQVSNDGNCFDEQVNSYHDFGIPLDGLGDELQVLAVAGKYAEAIIHPRARHLGIMWHPERNAPFSRRDVELFSRFLSGKTIS